MLLVNQTKMIIFKEESVLKAKRKVKCLKNELELLIREKQQMIDAQLDQENALRLKKAELQLFKEMMMKQGKREYTKELEEIIQAKELEIARLRDELTECEKKLKEVAEESSKLRNELLQTSSELAVKYAEVSHLQIVRDDNREAINSLKISLQLQIQQHLALSDSMKQLKVISLHACECVQYRGVTHFLAKNLQLWACTVKNEDKMINTHNCSFNAPVTTTTISNF